MKNFRVKSGKFYQQKFNCFSWRMTELDENKKLPVLPVLFQIQPVSEFIPFALGIVLSRECSKNLERR